MHCGWSEETTTNRMNPTAPKYRELSAKDHGRAVAMILANVRDGKPKWGSFSIVAKKFGFARQTISRLWARACLPAPIPLNNHEKVTFDTPQIISRKKSRDSKPIYLCRYFCEAVYCCVVVAFLWVCFVSFPPLDRWTRGSKWSFGEGRFILP